eukprot:GHVR01172425.1.p2 GENE.GHVR01172425.1~~GHVR01172425.1.p2  ORF type:complete len:239 (-),score=16.30 GHVR01172425.1:43-759(-)
MTGSDDCTVKHTRTRSGHVLVADVTNLDRATEGVTTTHTTHPQATYTQARTLPTLPNSGVEDLTGLSEAEQQEFIRKTLQETKASDERRTRMETEVDDRYLELKRELCADLRLQLQSTFTPSFNKISETMTQLVKRCDAQYSDLTNRHKLLARSIQDTTPVANPFNLPVLSPAKVYVPEFNLTQTNGDKDLKTLIGNIQDVSDPQNSKEQIWRRMFRMDNRIIPPFEWIIGLFRHSNG